MGCADRTLLCPSALPSWCIGDSLRRSPQGCYAPRPGTQLKDETLALPESGATHGSHLFAAATLPEHSS